MRLIIIQNDRPLTIPLNKNEMILGRSSKCDIQVHNPKISRQHLIINLEGKTIKVTDLKSRNGFQVGGKNKSIANFNHNESFTIGPLRFIFQEYEDEIFVDSLSEDDITPIHTEISDNFEGTALSAHAQPKQLPVTEQNHFSDKPSFQFSKLILPILVVILSLSTIYFATKKDTPSTLPISQNQKITTQTVENYLSHCSQAIKTFEDYFERPSRHFSQLEKAIHTLEKALTIKKYQRLKAAQELSLIFNTFHEVGYLWENFTDGQLNQLLASTQILNEARKTSPDIKNFSKKLTLWAESQLGALNLIDQVRHRQHSDNTNELLEAHNNLQSLETDHIFHPMQIKLQNEIAQRLGLLYLQQGKDNLRLGNEEEGREFLSKASEFGQEEKALSVLNQYNQNFQDDLLIEQAQKAFEKDNLTKANRLMNQINNVDRYKNEIGDLVFEIKRRKLLLDLRSSFTLGHENRIDQLIRSSEFAKDPFVVDLHTSITNTLNTFKKAMTFYKEENYEPARNLFYSVIDQIQPFDMENYYKKKAISHLKLMTSQTLSDKHYRRGIEAMNKVSPDYYRARRDFAVAEKYRLGIAKREIKKIVDHVSRQITWYYTVRQNGDSKDIEQELVNLRNCLTWLMPPANSETDSEEARLYHSLQAILNK